MLVVTERSSMDAHTLSLDKETTTETLPAMENAELVNLVIDALHEVAPEADVAALDPARSFHDQIDIDSIDFLNLMLTLEGHLNIRIAEADYPMLSTLNGCVAYLNNKIAAAMGTSIPNS